MMKDVDIIQAAIRQKYGCPVRFLKTEVCYSASSYSPDLPVHVFKTRRLGYDYCYGWIIPKRHPFEEDTVAIMLGKFPVITAQQALQHYEKRKEQERLMAMPLQPLLSA